MTIVICGHFYGMVAYLNPLLDVGKKVSNQLSTARPQGTRLPLRNIPANRQMKVGEQLRLQVPVSIPDQKVIQL